MEQLGINLNGLIAQLINFVVLYFLLSKFLFPRVTQMLDARVVIRVTVAEQFPADDAKPERESQRSNGDRQQHKIHRAFTPASYRIEKPTDTSTRTSTGVPWCRAGENRH